MQETVTIPPELSGQRLDKALAQLLPDLSRARVQALLSGGFVTPAHEASLAVKEGAVYEVEIPPAKPVDTKGEDIPLEIVFEDEDVIVINKPAGLVVHPAAGNWDGTLVNALLWHRGEELSGIGGEQRPGIVHRLDKETSGLMVVAKNDLAHRNLTSQFSDRQLSRTYLALVWGVPEPRQGRIEAPVGRDPKNRKRMAVLRVGGKDAITDYVVEKVLAAGQMALVRCKLLTGRTHQIRVHMAHIRCPIAGDQVYGGRRKNALEGFSRQALHAAELDFAHPKSGKLMHFEAGLPEDFANLLERV
jgi:23S rRNA pseudouridine1911/1915/1917 synthase